MRPSHPGPGANARSLAIADRCIAWNPVPPYANHWFELGVARFELRSLSNMDAASAVVFAPKEGGGGGYRGLDAWRISFEQVLAMRYGPIREWSGASHAPRPEDFEAGAWEVDPSSWLAQITPASYGGRLHHYVLTYNDAIYEIAAGSWRAEPLPEGWELAEEMRRGPRP